MWGDELDVLLYSVITGKRVKTVMSSKNGFVCVQDTLEELNVLQSVLSGPPLKTKVSRTSPTQMLLYHVSGKICESNAANDHYGALVEIDSTVCLRAGSIVYEGTGKKKLFLKMKAVSLGKGNRLMLSGHVPKN